MAFNQYETILLLVGLVLLSQYIEASTEIVKTATLRQKRSPRGGHGGFGGGFGGFGGGFGGFGGGFGGFRGGFGGFGGSFGGGRGFGGGFGRGSPGGFRGGEFGGFGIGAGIFPILIARPRRYYPYGYPYYYY